MNDDIDWALKTILAHAPDYARTRGYYEGKQPLAFATPKFNEAFGGMFRAFADNTCGVVVDTVADRLQIAGFTVADSPAEAGIREIWRRNRMNKRAGEVHQDALVDADAYVIVWPDEQGFPVLYPNRAHSIAVHYDEEQPGYITRAAKAWIGPDGHTRLNLYYRDKTEKYRTRQKAQGGMSEKPGEYEEFEPPVANKYGKVPVFHFANRASVGSLGRAEHSDAIPLQDALNKSVADMLVAMEFSALPQRWATGLQQDDDPRMRPGGIWAVDTVDTRFGEFAAGDITRFLAVAEGFRKEIARVTRTPAHYFSLEGSMPSGESMKTAEAPLLAKVTDKQIAWGNVWADVVRFAVEVAGGGEIDPECVWRDTTPRNDRDMVDIAKVKQELGVSREQTLRELGYEVAEIEQFEEDRATKEVIPEEIM